MIRRPLNVCLLYTSPSPRDRTRPRMPSFMNRTLLFLCVYYIT
ncbi:hypothetical protein PVA38_10805 [Streptococcus pneumoniae D39]|nr:hypothetical protein PVA38_10805 [Streptococcus pneumoniae D39]